MSSDMEEHVLVSDTVLKDRDGSVEDRGEKAYLEWEIFYTKQIKIQSRTHKTI